MGWTNPEPVRQKDAKDILAEEFSNQYVKVCNCGGCGFVAVRYDPETHLEISINHPLFGVPIPCICKRDANAKKRAERLRVACGMSDREIYEWRFETFKPEYSVPAPGMSTDVARTMMDKALHDCQQYAAHPEGWLVLQGPPGTGKTHLAFAIAGTQLAKNRPVFAHNVPALFELLRQGVKHDTYEQWLDGIKDVQLLVLDDLGAHRSTDWTADTLFQIINHRYAKRLPMVVTSNQTLDEADNAIEPRILSRLREGSMVKGGWTKAINFPVQDYRPRAIRRAQI